MIKRILVFVLTLLSGIMVTWAFNRSFLVTVEPVLSNSAAVFVPKAVATSSSVTIRGMEITVDIARDNATIQKGLSGRLSLSKNHGMLFIFPITAIYQFWMPDMHFPIDIIWISGNTIVGITPNVSNVFDPKNPKFYKSPRSANLVLEVNGGIAKEKKWAVGDIVTFNNIK